MTSFIRGMTFTMGGKEYEVVNEGTNDPSSCLVYVPRQERETADPQSLRMWKAEAKLARGDIMISGYTSDKEENRAFYPPIVDPLEQIAELKRRIQAIEQRRLTLLKAEDPRSVVLVQDNVVRPNKQFDIWAYTSVAGDAAKKERPIQYIRIRGVVLVISSAGETPEHFLFNISDQLQPCCRIVGDTLSSEGRIRLDLTPELQTVRGLKTQILAKTMGGRIELSLEIGLDCKYRTGLTTITARILQAAYIRDVNGPGLKFNSLAFPEIGEHVLAVEGVCVDIYTEGRDKLD